MSLPFDLTEDATADLEAAVAYLAGRSEASAMRIADALEMAFLLLSQHPHIGHRELAGVEIDRIRFWNAAGHIIAYLPEHSPILILAVIHGSRDAEIIIGNRARKL